jgi:hypothetical protein
MKKAVLAAVGLALATVLGGQTLREETTVVNVGVPVRVFQGSDFVDDLKLDDFEVYEDGRLQKLEAVYLVHGTAVARREEISRYAPDTNRHFYLFFEISEFTSQIGQALDYFVEKVIRPGDTLSVVTPLRTYRLRLKALEVQSKPRIADQLKGLVRQDSLTGNFEYVEVVKELQDIARALAIAIRTSQADPNSTLGLNDASAPFLRVDSFPEELILQYAAVLSRLDALRRLDFEKISQFASLLKDEGGQKYVFIFYQREFLPQVDPRLLNSYLDLNQERPDIQHAAASIFDFYRRYNNFDVNRVKESYADASIGIHFLFISEPVPHVPGLIFREKSEDVYAALREMAVATGGFFEASANPSSLLKDAVDSAENYYLLYYSPQNTVRDGRFRRITVKVKNRDCRVSYRQGYIAN